MSSSKQGFDIYMLSLSTLLVGMVISITLYFYLTNMSHKRLQETIHEHINTVVFDFEQTFKKGINKLKRLSEYSEWPEAITEKSWKYEAKEDLEDLPYMHAIRLTDLKRNVRWSVITKPYDSDAFTKWKRQLGLSSQYDHGMYVFSPIPAGENHRVVFVSLPVMQAGKLQGFSIGTFSLEDMLDSILPRHIKKKYHLSLLHNGKAVYSDEVDSKPKSSIDRVSISKRLYESTWVFQMSPTEETLRNVASSMPFFIMLFVLSITLLLTIVIFFWYSLMVTLNKIKHTQRQLYESQKYEAIGQLAGGVAHEFNNILQGIIGCASLLNCYVEENDKAKEKANLIIESAKRGARLTKSLLAYARKSNYDFQPIGVDELCKNLIDIVQPSVGKSVQIIYQPSHEELVIRADADHLLQALMNLCINARDAMDGEGRIDITTEGVEELGHAWVQIKIRDNGSGIPQDLQRKIFEPFFTTKPSGKGTGLGLSMVIGTVQEHQGTIDVESEEGVGTCFRIRLPRLESSERAHIRLATQETDKSRPSYVDYLKDKTCLLIDDEQIILDVLATYVEQLGGSTLTAANGHIGLDVYSKHGKKIDFVFLDWMMPEMSGEETYRAIREISSRVILIISTGCTDVDLIHSIIENDPHVYFLSKPYQLEGLVDLLDQM